MVVVVAVDIVVVVVGAGDEGVTWWEWLLKKSIFNLNGMYM